MKIKFACAAVAVAMGFAAQAHAEDAAFTITGDAAVVSQYRFRGLAQTDNKPTAQMALTVQDKDGFYISTWGSGSSITNGSEIDIYGGYTHEIAKTGITFDGGLYGYVYPNMPAADLYEAYGSLSKSYGPLGLKVGANWAPKQHYFTVNSAGSQYNMYEYAEATVGVPNTALTVHGHLGHSGGGLNVVSPTGVSKEYLDYTVGAGYKYKSLTLDLSLVGTNLTTAGSGAANYRLGKAVPVLSLTANF